uniref:C-type lectin domain-containing protein n=1 Tax=Sphaeramia orbicularis TaxID=375764 RepID=A0A673AZB7_9TELE
YSILFYSILFYSILFYLLINTCLKKPPPTPAPGDGMCMPFFVPYGRYCYTVYNELKGYSWSDARLVCQSFRAELASVHSRAEVEFLRTLNGSKYHNIWIGLTRDRNCEFTAAGVGSSVTDLFSTLDLVPMWWSIHLFIYSIIPSAKDVLL